MCSCFSISAKWYTKNRKATTYHLRGGYKREELKNFGVVLGDEWPVVYDNIITSSCPKTAPDVAFQLLELEMLTLGEIATNVIAAMGY